MTKQTTHSQREELAGRYPFISLDRLPQELKDIIGEEIDAAIAQTRKDTITGVLEKLPTLKQDEHPTDPETGVAVEVYGFEATHNQAIDAVAKLLTKELEKKS